MNPWRAASRICIRPTTYIPTYLGRYVADQAHFAWMTPETHYYIGTCR